MHGDVMDPDDSISLDEVIYRCWKVYAHHVA
jgi:hypothetical protein